MSEPTIETPDWEDADFLGGRLRLRQFRGGHRAGTDAVLLAAFVEATPNETLIDAGAGIGAAGLAVLSRAPGVKAILVERHPATAALARYNVTANGFDTNASVVEADIFDLAVCRSAALTGVADVVISNPPFFEPGTVRPSNDSRRAEAHVLDRGTHADWLLRIASFLKPNGRLVMIHRPDALPSLLSAATSRFGGMRILPVYPREGQAAIRILMSMRRGSKAPLSLLSPLPLHGENGFFTPKVESLHRGELGLCIP
ncbi:tRNA1(Val) (adenine(37)-N6)-methyltransferase [Lichenifustis flavocetrariae]|uniref:Methyltransferase n=1 Tax=Lichenifustis flavocetrariae TaxID=2949735 RepID=A0AA42CL86_9HYPH|nr:methyltransferase [Lichenifustis flavocetrariae]MCW6507127.1 methyltransferase [Lichenifustis flavocetrariae]